MKQILRVEDLHIDFELPDETVHAVRGIDFAINEGETLAIVGESGSGKSATALATLQLNPAPPVTYPRGRILLDGRDLLRQDRRTLRKIRGNDIAMIFQDPMASLNPLKRVGTQILEVLRLHRSESRGSHRKLMLAALDDAGIPDVEKRARQFPHQLSGGLRQRVMIAMAIVAQPRILIADEPTTALDVTVQSQILDVLVSLQAEYGMAMILISHDLGVVAETADNVAVMNKGAIVERGNVVDVFARPDQQYTRNLLAATPRLDTSATQRGGRTNVTGRSAS
ncbi:ATP-binding cassette domain-containing protein [Spelaeicoccus albus]|uniref:ABC-type dipeptide/oligopeptide/nickel transport system ATPase component n=1 Tax=Spelaeicoccus albus TaxID=1280376 RepID=A0A7Z0D1W1_9MICO|nr:ABC transporter ATP-binding protein [Spelaeicoccus albus]NYI67047.1 ABC-type dipeptide/oligopeptide/nickel transport system ATPase component [Spelaeicoccus albus]